ncbi:TonB-dependent siderophore receptor, partial [Azospirillum brasilense]|nr:TonB-dependent siderophore receptor [Azospirillum brasilense]
MTPRLAGFLLGGLALGWSVPAAPSAALSDSVQADSVQPASQDRPLAIPALPLGEALTRFGQQTGLQILYSPDLVSGRRSRVLAGRMAPATALAELLDGTGLSFDLRDGMATIGQPQETADVLPPLTVEGRPLHSSRAASLARPDRRAGRTETPAAALSQGAPPA